jgi:hypothetical protein
VVEEQVVEHSSATAGTVNTGGGGGGGGGAPELEEQEDQESLLLEHQEVSEFRSKSRHKYSNYITSPSRRLQSSYIYSIRNINNINDYVLSF